MLALVQLVLSLATIGVALIASLPSLSALGLDGSRVVEAVFGALRRFVGPELGVEASPYFDPVLYWVHKLGGPSFAQSQLALYATSALIVFAVLVAAALIAAILSKLSPRSARPFVTQVLWLAVTVALAWPALRTAAGHAI